MKLSAKTNNEISSTVRNWYEFSRELIPTIGTHSFTSFVAGSSALSSQVTNKVVRYRFIIDPQSDSAYIDSENEKIALPIWYFDEKVLGEMFGPNSDLEAVSLSLCNGSHIHEALHARFTEPPTITAFYNNLPDGDKRFMLANSEVANTIMNIVEDMFIESAGRATLNDFLNDMVQTKNTLLFPPEEIATMVKAAAEAKTPAERATFKVQLFTALKNVKLRKSLETNPLLSEVFGVAAIQRPSSFYLNTEQKRKMLTTVERTNYACAVTKAILSGLSEAERKELASKVGDGSGSDGKEKAAAGKGTKMMVSTEKTPGSMGVESELSEKEKAAIKSEFEAAAKMVAMTVGMKADDDKEKNKSSFVGMRPVEYYDDIFQFAARTSRFDLRAGTNNFSFVNTLRQLRTKNHTTGVVRTSGNHLINQRLYRIGTDGKMFSNLEHEKEMTNRLAVVILIDASGSMGSMYADVVVEAMGMFKALRENNIPTAVYAHTSADKDSTVPGLYRIIDGGIKRNETQVEARFNAALSINLSENYDGAIIEALTKRVFAELPANTKKILFVLSDGSPLGAGYGGSEANNHTKAAIKAARELGIFVAAISLVSHVVRNNNEIYGPNYNVDASASLKKSFESLVVKMQAEGRL